MFEVIPAIDLLDGKVVRLTKGDYDRVEEFPTDPEEFAKRFEDNGASKIHIVDLDGAKEGRLVNHKILERIRACVNCEIEFGGGVRNAETVNYLVNLGIDFIVLGSILVKNPELSHQIIASHPKKIVAGVDIKNDKVAIEGWIEDSQLSTNTLLNQLNDHPIAYLISTDIDRDGMMSGPSLDSLLDIAKVSKHPVVASGGVRNISDIELLKSHESDGISGCIVGKAILSGKIPLESLWPKHIS
jgi:phosphoribosylformimino-5-aminoimidazole carboxamide ribotide isomerase